MFWQTTTDNKVQEVKLRKQPVIITVNKFTEDSAKSFRIRLNEAMNTGQTVIPIVIDSYGGQAHALMSMVSMIKACPIPVATIVTGKAMSCGAVLASCGTDGMRYIDPDATVMIHEVSSVAWGKNEEVQASAEETHRLNDKVLTMLSRNCGQADDFIAKEIHNRGHADWFLDAKESNKIGLINHIKIPTFEVKVTVDIGLKE